MLIPAEIPATATSCTTVQMTCANVHGLTRSAVVQHIDLEVVEIGTVLGVLAEALSRGGYSYWLHDSMVAEAPHGISPHPGLRVPPVSLAETLAVVQARLPHGLTTVSDLEAVAALCNAVATLTGQQAALDLTPLTDRQVQALLAPSPSDTPDLPAYEGTDL